MTSNNRIVPFLLVLCMFFTGGAGIIGQLVLGKTTTDILGNAYQQLAIVIAMMMLGMGVASRFQARLSDRWLLLQFGLVETVLTLLSSFAPIGLLYGYAMFPDHFQLIMYSSVFAIGYLIGFEIPLIMRVNETYGLSLKENAGSVVSADYVGSAFAGLVFAFWLLGRFPTTEISFIAGAINFAVAAFTVLYITWRTRWQWVRLAATLSVLATLGFGYVQSGQWTAATSQHLYEDPIVFQTTTRYQHIILTQNLRVKGEGVCGDPTVGDVRLYLNTGTQYSSIDECIYHDNLVHPVMHAAHYRKRVLILGGGDGFALRDVLSYPDVEHVTLVDLDPEMVRLAREVSLLRQLNKDAFYDARVSASGSLAVTGDGYRSISVPTGRIDQQTKGETYESVADVQIQHVDALNFLNEVSGFYDVVIIDLPDPKSIGLNKLYTIEFYWTLQKRLSRNAMVAIQSTSPVHAKEVFLQTGRTMQAAGFQTLPYHDYVPSFGEWGWHLAWASEETTQAVKDRLSAVEAFDVETKHLTPEKMMANFVFGRTDLKTDQTVVNRIVNPTLYVTYQNEAWKFD